jgi:NADH-quinone oxidoreductase subunit E
MAWIAKNAAQEKIELRDEPYLNDAMRDKLTNTYLPRYETKKGALMPALHMVQHAYGWIPPQAMQEIAAFLELAPSEVHDTASFYEEYWLAPKGDHLIAVCRSVACEFCGQPAVTDAVKAKLGIDVGETTDDNKFTLIELECIGACDGAPAILLDENLHTNVTPESIGNLIDEADKD